MLNSSICDKLIYIKTKKFFDSRGFFAETYSRKNYLGYGIDVSDVSAYGSK